MSAGRVIVIRSISAMVVLLGTIILYHTLRVRS